MDYISTSEISGGIEARIALNLTPKRLAHCRSTARTAVMLAHRFGEDEEACHLAGLSHDMCREWSYDEQQDIVGRHGDCIGFLADRSSLKALFSDEEFKKKMLHGPAAACVLCRDFGIADHAVLEAGALHSIADEKMSPCAKIVYISDKLEPLRNRPGDAQEKLNELDLPELFAYTIACVVRWFSESGKPLSPYTSELYSGMLKKWAR